MRINMWSARHAVQLQRREMTTVKRKTRTYAVYYWPFHHPPLHSLSSMGLVFFQLEMKYLPRHAHRKVPLRMNSRHYWHAYQVHVYLYVYCVHITLPEKRFGDELLCNRPRNCPNLFYTSSKQVPFFSTIKFKISDLKNTFILHLIL